MEEKSSPNMYVLSLCGDSYLLYCNSFYLWLVHCTRADKEAKRGEKQLIKQLDRDKREAEKEKRRLDRELKKEKLQSVSLCILFVYILSMPPHVWPSSTP